MNDGGKGKGRNANGSDSCVKSRKKCNDGLLLREFY